MVWIKKYGKSEDRARATAHETISKKISFAREQMETTKRMEEETSHKDTPPVERLEQMTTILERTKNDKIRAAAHKEREFIKKELL